MKRGKWVGGGLIGALAVLVAVGLWKTTPRGGPEWIPVVHRPEGIMGTTSTLAAVVGPGDESRGEAALGEAEAELRAVETLMSTWLDDSEISRLNGAKADEEVPLLPETLEVLRSAREAWGETRGAFDVTCRPLVELWKRAGERGTLPTEAELGDALSTVGWGMLELTDAGATKRAAAVRVDLGGIAKGYGVDRAVDVLERSGVAGGLVDVGGDLRCFGRPAEGPSWTVEIRNPFGPAPLGRLALPHGAVCTSGNYARFTEIEGKRYSHIIDPRSGWPADAVPAVTVVAPTALEADVWSTALSVLGPEGFALMPTEVHALMVLGSKNSPHILCTPGFSQLIEEPPAAALHIPP